VSRSGPRSVLRWAGQHDEVSVGITQPDLPLLGVGVYVHITLDLGFNPSCALHRRVEIRDLEPEQDTVAE